MMEQHNKLILSKQWFIDSHQGNIKDIYHFIERLGSGGFGVVYLAENRKTGNTITFKDEWWYDRCEICDQGYLEKQSQRLRNVSKRNYNSQTAGK